MVVNDWCVGGRGETGAEGVLDGTPTNTFMMVTR